MYNTEETGSTLRIYEWTGPDNIIVYERSGSCCRCGQCCEGCEHLIMMNSFGSCSVINEVGKDWDMGCKVWPSEPQHIENHSSCSYAFRVVEVKEYGN